MQPIRAHLHACALAFALILLPGAALAILPHDPGLAPAGASLVRHPPFILAETRDAAWSASRAAADPAFQSFLEDSGGSWVATWDRRTDRPALIWGSGLPWIPGRGNDLRWERVLGVKEPTEEQVLAHLEAKARELLARHPGLFRVPSRVTLVRDDVRSGSVGDRVWQLTLAATVQGVPVPRAFVTFRLNSGNVIQLGAQHLQDSLGSVNVQPRIPSQQALSLAWGDLEQALGRPLTLAAVPESGRLQVLPWATDPRVYAGEPGQGLSYRLAWRVVARVKGGLETWNALVDATSGARLALWDDNRYACPPPPTPQGRVTGGVFLGPVEEVPEVRRGMPYAAVDNGGLVVADFNGLYSWTPGAAASTSLSGQPFDVECTNCTNPPQALVASSGSGFLDLGTGGTDGTGNGLSTRAERSSYYHLNIVRALAAKHLTDAEVNGWFSRTVPSVVDIPASCNAFFDGNGVNFFRSSANCNNTGEIADVMQHEWGHGIDFFTGGGDDGARGEGVGDTVAFFSTHDGRMGPYFLRGDANGLPGRQSDESINPDGTFATSTIDTQCDPAGGGGNGPLGFEVHCEGVIFSQANWHLAVELRAKYGELAGWHAAERLFFQSLPLSDTYVPNQARSTYDAVMAVDDDNGNLTDGTPNATEINTAFSHHGMTGTPAVIDSAGDCVAPAAAPALTTQVRTNAATGQAQVEVAWTSDPAVTEYHVLRNDADGRGADLIVARLFAPFAPNVTYLDDNVYSGVTYRYRVSAFDNRGCMSQNDNLAQAVVPAQVALILSSWALDDAAANFNGVADPGETIALPVTVRNIGVGPASAVTATLETTAPNVTIVNGTLAFGDLASGASGASVAPHFVVRVEAGAACPATIPFTVSLDATEGCSASAFSVPVGRVVSFQTVAGDDLETDTGWRANAAGTDDATAGLWVREAPIGTYGEAQSAADHTPGAGTRAWVTGNAPQDRSQFTSSTADDVDGGCTTLTSPTWALSGETGLVLSYWRWFVVSAEPDDTFLVEISNDGGGAWRTLEELSVSAVPWTEARFALDGVLGAAPDRVVLRFTACDRGNGSVIEAGVDDVTLLRPQFECENPSPRPRLDPAGWTIADDPAAGGVGNVNGAVEPGENVRLILGLVNATGNATATAVAATLSIVSAPAGVTVSDAAGGWPDIAVGATETTGADAVPHFEIALDDTVGCGETIELAADVTYSGPAGTWGLRIPLTLTTGFDFDVPIFFDDVEGGDNGWISVQVANRNDWTRGAPQSNSPWDPPAAHSGTNIWGTDLGNNGGNPSDGNYARNAEYYLESSRIDCSAATGVKLSYWRVLSGEDSYYDQLELRVNGTVLSSNPMGLAYADSGWTYMEHDISAIADGVADVRIRFSVNSDGGFQLGGWNLDDIRVFTRTRECATAGCGVIASPAPTGPVLRATGNKGLDGAEYAWVGAPLAAGESFVLYRGSAPDDLSVVVTPPDHVADRHDDRTAPGGPWFYTLVRANCHGESAR